MKAEHRRSLVALTFFLGVLGFGLADGVIPVDASQQLPERSTSPHPDCSSEPGRPDSYPGLAGLSDRASFPVVGSIDANGCDSWVYELLGSFGPDGSFFAGPGFHTGLHAYQYGTQETTEILDGRQLIRVADPTKEWKRVRQGVRRMHNEGGGVRYDGELHRSGSQAATRRLDSMDRGSESCSERSSSS